MKSITNKLKDHRFMDIFTNEKNLITANRFFGNECIIKARIEFLDSWKTRYSLFLVKKNLGEIFSVDFYNFKNFDSFLKKIDDFSRKKNENVIF